MFTTGPPLLYIPVCGCVELSMICSITHECFVRHFVLCLHLSKCCFLLVIIIHSPFISFSLPGAAPSFSSMKPALTTATMNHLHTTIGLPTEIQRIHLPSTDPPESQEGWGVPKKHRTQFSPAQLLYLEETFSSNQFPILKERDRIATKLDLTLQHVQVGCLV